MTRVEYGAPTLFVEDPPFHPVANLFPLMDSEEYRQLREDIRRHGLREPIWLYEEKIIDGRNRYFACMELGIEPATQRFSCDGSEASLASFVISLNLHRRHLTASQRACIGAEVLPIFEADAEARKQEACREAALQQHHPDSLPERVLEIFPEPIPTPTARDRAGESVGVSGRYVQNAKALQAEAPALYEQVKAGAVPIQDAVRQRRKERERQRIAELPIPDLPDRAIVELGDSTEHLKPYYADMILCDPPYNISDSAKLTKVGDSIQPAVFDEEWDLTDPGEYRAHLDDWAREWYRLLASGGSVVSFVDRRMISYLWDACDDAGLQPKGIITWEKRNPAPNGLVRKSLISATEFLLWAVKPGLPWTFRETPLWDRRNVIVTNIISATEKVDHPTQKPLDVLLPLIDCFSMPQDTVLDMFAGSGSTGVAALRLGRYCHLIERDAGYVTLARHRLAEEEKAHAA